MSGENIKVNSLACSICGGKLEIDESQENIECPYCGATYAASELSNESDAVKIETIKSNAYKDVEMAKLEHVKEQAKIADAKEKVQAFKKGKFSKFLIACAVISSLSCAASFSDGKILSGIIALIQAVLYAGSWLMGMQIIQEPKKGVRAIATILAFALILPYVGTYNAATSRVEKISWDDIMLCDELPKPHILVGEVHTNSNEGLWIDIPKTTLSDYKEYVAACEAFGFTIDAENGGDSFVAYNDAGNKISVRFSDYSKELTIDFDKAMTMGNITWPNTSLVNQLPTPKSSYGKVNYEHDDSYSVYLANISKSDYDAYVDECINAGFNVDYSKNEKTFWADNATGCHVSLEYRGNNIVYISIKGPDKADSSNDTGIAIEEAKEESSTSSNSISPDFKAAMDSYEKFFDEYVAIMKKYANNPADMSILADYSKYMGQYAKMMSDFEKWEDEDMNAAEAAYYVQVQGRITKKLLEIGQ